MARAVGCHPYRAGAVCRRLAWCRLIRPAGAVSCGRALALQRRLVREKKDGRCPDILVLLEHEPVITLGRRGDPSAVLALADDLRLRGISVHRVERGGQATYHGPGQLVGYSAGGLSCSL